MAKQLAVDKTQAVRDIVGEAEWEVRVNLAAFYRLVALHDMTDLVLGHLSARVPGTSDQFLLNPYPRLFEQITASNLVKVHADGNILLDVGFNYDIPAYTIHGALYGARHDVGSAAHTHTAAAMSFSAVPENLQPISPFGAKFRGALATHSFEGIFNDPKERQRLINDMGQKNTALLENHGYLVCAPTIPQCWSLLYDLEQATQAHLAALSSGGGLVQRPDEIVSADKEGLDHEDSVLMAERWESQCRLLDRIDPSYRE